MEFIHLPDHPLLHILSYLRFTDLSRCGLACHRILSLSLAESLWKRQCCIWWDTKTCPEDISWKENFTEWYKNFGKYWRIYRQIRHAWDKIELYMMEHCPGIYNSLQDGLSEMDLDGAEQHLGVKLPLDLRCVYRMHNGQNMNKPKNQGLIYGMFGTIKFSRYYCSELLLPMEAVVILQKKDWPTPCIGALGCIRSKIRVFVSPAGPPIGPNLPGRVFYAFDDRNRQSFKPSEKCDLFFAGSSFLDYFTSYAQKLNDEMYPAVGGEVLRFHHDTDAVATTEHVRISAATAFMPMLSSIEPPEFVFAYRITLSMASDVRPKYACQLETRTWYITDDNGEVETVNGPGVVGEYPVVRPGSEFSYISCTHFSTTQGTMHGIYTMRNLATGETLDAEVPLFRMKCPPFLALRSDT